MTAAERAAAATEAIWAAVDAGEKATVVNSPPGAGKSTLVREIGRRTAAKTQVPVLVQTNEQADDMVRGFLADQDRGLGEGMLVGRLHKKGYPVPPDIGADARTRASTDLQQLRGCSVIVSTAHKWAYSGDRRPFAIVDEAYQMRSDLLMPTGARTDRLLLVGDPGQLSPFTDADDTVLRGMPMSPIDTAAGTVLMSRPDAPVIALPVSWRLPPSAATVISGSFYDMPFEAGVASGVRALRFPLGSVDTVEQVALRTAAAEGWALLTLPDLLMPVDDPGVVASLAALVAEVLDHPPIARDEHGERRLDPGDIAVGVTHRSQQGQVAAVVDRMCAERGLPPGSVTVDTANKLQGRQFELVIVWHPLSGRRDASAFHLEAGRLCVLLSRHRQACVVVTRGGLREQLEAHPSTDPVWLGERLPVVDGWSAHLALLDHLERYTVAA
ncbi:hypothetical protein ACI8AF_00320 [Blastococcus sp. SYSU D00669]